MALPKVGQTVAEKYRVDEVIGEGGFAVVYRATDTLIDRSVALKIAKPTDSELAVESISRFGREARAVAALTGPHTVKMFDYGRTSSGLLYLVFELLGGEDLAQLLERGPLDQATTVHVLRQVLMSLREAHGAGLLHRDVKPGNIRVYEYMDDTACVKLMDFGIAWADDPDAAKITQTGFPVGTPRYMSPEHLMGGDLTPAADIYSLGLVAHEMLTCAEQAPVQEILRGEEVDVPASRELRAIINRMLKQDARDRYQSAEAVLGALDSDRRFAHGSQETTIIEEPPEPDQPAQSKPVVLIGLAGVALLIAIVLVVQSGLPEPQAPQQDSSRLKDALRAQPATKGAVAPALTPDASPRDAGSVAQPDGCGRTPARVGDLPQSKLEGLERTSWLTYLPKGYDPEKPHPLMVVFEAGGHRPADVLGRMKMRPFADQHGVVLIAPAAPTGVWYRDIDIEPFVRAVEGARRDFCIDENRIFALGHGLGAWPLEALTCEPWLAAAATTSARLQQLRSSCSPARAVPRIMYSPTETGFLPIRGGRNCVGVPIQPLQAYEQMWRDRNSCSKEEQVVSRHGQSFCKSWDCASPFQSCEIEGGFDWPGAPRIALAMGECADEPPDFDYLPHIWKFFQSIAPPPDNGR